MPVLPATLPLVTSYSAPPSRVKFLPNSTAHPFQASYGEVSCSSILVDDQKSGTGLHLPYHLGASSSHPGFDDDLLDNQ